MTDTSEPEDDRWLKAAAVVYKEQRDALDVNLKAQVEIGKWLLSSLFIMHGAALTGLFLRTPLKVENLKLGYWFVGGIVAALAAGFVVFINLKLSAELVRDWASHNLLLDPKKYWPKPEPAKQFWITLTYYTAMILAAGSTTLLCIGAIQVATGWKE